MDIKQESHRDITFLKLPDVCKKTALSRSTVYKQIKAGTFPKQIKLTEHSSAWIASEIQEWANDVVAQRDLVSHQKEKQE